MSGPNIRITVQLGHYPENTDRSFCIPLDEYLVRESHHKLDFPSPDADALVSSLFCSSPEMIKRTIRNREGLVELVKRQLDRVLRETLEAADTQMGYKPKPADQDKWKEDSDAIFTAISSGAFEDFAMAERAVVLLYVTDMSYTRAGISHALSRLERHYKPRAVPSAGDA